MSAGFFSSCFLLLAVPTQGHLRKTGKPYSQTHPTAVTNNSSEREHSEIISPWNGSDVLGSDGRHKCKRYVVSHGTESTDSSIRRDLNRSSSIDMCLRDYPDLISDQIKKDGRWKDCDVNEQLWKALPGKGDIFVDIGSNIGACTLPMLSRSDVDSVVAFEPNPNNLFYLTSSVLLNTGYRSRFRLFPIGLGEETSKVKIYSQSGNAGNTVLGSQVGNRTYDELNLVDVRRLDDIVKMGQMTPIRVMKMDAQGYEVHILKGADALLSSGSVAAIHFEVQTKWLVAQNTTGLELLSLLISKDYSIHETVTGDPLQHDRLCEIARSAPSGFNLIAKYQPIGHRPKTLQCLRDDVNLVSLHDSRQETLKSVDELLLDRPSTAPYNLTHPSKKSYSQWLQDITLQPILSSFKKGFFVESGGQDGEKNSNTLKYERDGWSGLIVEPQRDSLRTLRLKNRKAYIFAGALSPSGRSTQISFSPGQGPHSSGRISVAGSVDIQAQPLAILLRAVNQTAVHFWSLDVEGFEGDILNSTDFAAIEVGTILVEINKGSKNVALVEVAMARWGFLKIGSTYYQEGVADIQSRSKDKKWLPLDAVYVNPRFFLNRGLKVPERIDENITRYEDVLVN